MCIQDRTIFRVTTSQDPSWSSLSQDLLKSIAQVQGSWRSDSTAVWPNSGRRCWEIRFGLHGWIQLAYNKTTHLRGSIFFPPWRSAYPVSTWKENNFQEQNKSVSALQEAVLSIYLEAGRAPGKFLSILNLSPHSKPYLLFLSLSHPLPSAFCLKESEPFCLYSGTLKTDIRQLRISTAVSTLACPPRNLFKTIPSKLFLPSKF